MDIWYKSKRLGAGLICILLAMIPTLPESSPITEYIPTIQAGLGAAGAILSGASKMKEGKT